MRPRGTAPNSSVQLAPLSLCSSVPMALEGKENILLHTCFTSVFLLPPEEEMRSMENYFYLQVRAG